MNGRSTYPTATSIRELAWGGAHRVAMPAPAEPIDSAIMQAGPAPTASSRSWSISRVFALIFMLIAAALTGFALREGLAARDTGLLCLMSAIAAATVLYGLPSGKTLMRGLLAFAIAAFASLGSLILLPAFQLWPAGAGPLIFSMIFAIVGTVTRSRLCLAMALLALFGLMVDADGLTRMRLDAQFATLGLFGIGLFGGVIAGSRLIASIATLAVMAATLTLLASFGVPAAAALAILSVFAITAAIALRGFLRQGYATAKFPMLLSCIVFGLAGIAFQLNLMGELGSGALTVSGIQSQTMTLILIGFQAVVLFVSLIGWFSGRASLIDVVLTQAMLGLVCIVIVDPSRLARLDMGDPALVLAGFVGLIIATLSAVALYRSWKNGQPILAALSALALMMEGVIGLRLLSGDFDMALAGLICMGVALSLAALMALNPRPLPLPAEA